MSGLAMAGRVDRCWISLDMQRRHGRCRMRGVHVATVDDERVGAYEMAY
jgi:hypothetical protein